MKKRDVYMLIDSHALIHRAYHAIPYLQTKDGRPSGALFGLSNILLGAIEKFKPDYIFAANDLPKTTFREMAFKSYKAHRTKTEDFLVEQIVAMPDLFKNFGIPLLSQEGYEADDVIGTLVCKIQKEKTDYQVVILTGDMDIMQLIDDDRVVVYTAKKGEEEIIYHEEEVMKKYGLLPKQIPDYKGLRGDTSDNIPGIKGIGEKTAMQILQKGGTLKKVYELIDSGKDEEYFEITKRMFELLKNGKEDAEFSRELATINCDIEIDIPQNGKFVLKDHIHDLKDYCEDYGFVSIKRRLEKLENIGQKSGARKKDGEDEKIEMLDYFQENTQAETQTEVSVNKNETINFTPETFKKVQLALWLLDSSETNIDQERANYLTKKWGAKNEDEVLDRLVEELKTKNLEELYFEMELPLIEILNEANRVGIKVDREKLQKLLQKYEKEKDILVEEIYKQAGQTFNINSPKQLGEILFEKLKIQGEGPQKIKKTNGGKLSTRAEVLESMRDNHEIVAHILDYREKEKMINTYLEPLLTHSTFDGRVHTTFIQTGAATGRFASTNPNMQNIPVKGEEGKELRSCFVASEGKIFIAADYSQIELRVAGILSGDPYLIETYKKNEDIHTSVAVKMFNKDAKQITKDERNAAKALNFGIFYGMGVTAIKNNLKVERNVAQAFYDSYTMAVNVLMKYLKDTIEKTKETGFTETLYGRQRQVKELFSSLPMIRAQGERIAMNAPIQGTAADIIKWAMVDFKKRCIEKKWDEEKVAFILQIHDELLFEVDEEMKEEVCEELKKVMEVVIEKHTPKIACTTIPLVANIKLGKNWGEM